MYLFGGRVSWRETEHAVMRLKNCDLEKIGDLDFDFYDGTCAGTKNEMYLCFSTTKTWFGHLG